MIVTAKTITTAPAAAPTNSGTPQNPPVTYTPPAATSLGGLEQVLSNSEGTFYDGPMTLLRRYR